MAMSAVAMPSLQLRPVVGIDQSSAVPSVLVGVNTQLSLSPTLCIVSQGFSCECLAAAAVVASAVHLRIRTRKRIGGSGSRICQRATTVQMETQTGLAPWEIEAETEEERQARYKREAEEMKLKWDARRLEEKQSAGRRVAWSKKEKERASLYGPRDPIMEAYEARMYEEARVIEVRRRQREVYERIKAFKLGKPLPLEGEPYVLLKPLPTEPPLPEEFDISGRYDPSVDIEDQKYRAPESYVSPTGPAPPPRDMRGAPRAAWEDPPYGPPPQNARPSNYPKPGTPVAGRPFAAIEAPKTAKVSAPAAPAPTKAKVSAPAAPAAPVAPAAPAAPVAQKKEEVEGPVLPTVAEAKAMKVSELKSALSAAGLPISGTKAVLQARLIEAIEG